MEKIYFSPKCLYCIFAISFTFLLYTNSYGQVIPEGINYQAVARDTAGKPMAEVTDLAVRFSIFPDATSNDTIFSEVHSPVSTNIYGLFTRVIGSIDSIRFKNILWGSGDKYLEVKIAKTGQDYSAMGRMRLVSVPYALYSKNSGDSWKLYGNTADTAMFLGTINTTDLKIKTDSITRIRIGGNGNVIILTNAGIGVTNPNSKLAIQTAAGNELEFVSAITDTADITTLATLKAGTSSTSPVHFKTNDTSRVVIDSIGNVGIGNLSPVSRLDVAGKVKITDGSEGLGKVLSSDATGLASWVMPGAGTVLSFSADSLLPLFTTSVSDDTINPHLSFTLENAGAYTVFGNTTNAPAAPTYFSPQLNTALFQNQGTSTTLLHGNAAGNPFWGQVVNSDIGSGAVNLTTHVTGVLPMANGGSGAALSPVNGGIVYTNASTMQVSSAGTSGQVLVSGGAGSPSWTDPTNALTLNPLAPITVNVSSPSVYDIGVLPNSASSAGVVAAGTTNYYKVWKTDATGTPGWRVDSAGVYFPGTGIGFSGDTINSVWTASGNNIYNNNSGNVGIGITIPGAKLDVQNNSSAGSAGYFESTDSTNASPTLVAINDGNNGSALFVSETGLADAVVISVTNTSNSKDALQINTNGTDSKGLSVNNTGVSSTKNYGAYVMTTGTGNVNVAGYFNAENATENYAGIFENGNVGVGTTQPVAKLEVVTDGSNGADKAIYAETTGNGAAGSFVIANPVNNDNAVYAATDGTGNALYAENTGTGTAGSFAVSNPANTSPAVSVTSLGGISSPGVSVLHLGANTLDYGMQVFNIGTGTTNVAGYFSATGAINNYAAIFDNGNVGVGVNAPTDKFVVGNGNIVLLNNNNIAGKLLFGDPNGGGAFYTSFEAKSQTASIIYTLPAAQGATNTVLRNDGAGSLSWASVASLGAWTLTGNAGTSPVNNFIGTTDAADFVIRTSNAERMRVKSGGNVGVGTTAPAEKLDINGNLLLSNSTNTASKLLFSEPSTSGSNITSFEAQAQGANISYVLPATQGTANQVLSNNGSGTLSWATVSSLTGSGIINYVTKWASGTGLSNSIIFDNGTNVGIGTTTPSEKLDLGAGNLVTTGSLISKSGGHGLSLRDGANNERIYSNLNGGHGEFFLVNNGGTNTLKLNSNGISFFNGGNVGIGTNTPASMLDVEGGISIGATYSGSSAAPANGAIIEGNVGIGTGSVVNQLDVEGGVAIGATYSGSNTAPANGAIIEGNVGVGTTAPSINSRLAIKDGHLQSQQTTAPTIDSVVTYTAGSQVLSNATDVAGKISILTTAASGSVKIKFNKVYAVAPIVIVTAANNFAAADITKMWVTSTISGFTINFTDSGGIFPPIANTHLYYYYVIETQ